MTGLVFHLEVAADGPVWWVDSPDAPGFSAFAPTLEEARGLALEALGIDSGETVERLA